MLLSLPRQVVLLFLLLYFGRFVPQPGSDQKSDGNAGQKAERIHADIPVSYTHLTLPTILLV